MTREEQRAINNKAYAIFNSAINEWDKDGETNRFKLCCCQAEVICTTNYDILCSYETLIACIEKSTGTLVDVLRTEYGYTNTSAQHIRKFARQYFGDHYYPKTLVSRPV